MDKEASVYIFDFSSAANLTTGHLWDLFAKGNFKTVNIFTGFSRSIKNTKNLKKWLYKRGFSFVTRVFVLVNGDETAMLITWKMLIKYAAQLLFMDDVMVFDPTKNWCLFFFHENQLFW